MKMNLMMKILSGFLLVAVITGLGYGITIMEMTKNLKNIEDTQNIHFGAYEKISKLSTNIEKQVSLYRFYVLTSNDQAALQFEEISKENEELEQELMTLATSDEVLEQVKEIQKLNSQYSNLVLRDLIPIIKAGDIPTAHKKMLNEGSPVVVEMSGKVTNLTDLAAQGTIKCLELSRQGSSFAKFVSIIMAISIFFICILIGYFVARNISKPVVEMSGLMEDLAAGELMHESKFQADDEVGILSSSINKMIFQLKDLIKKIQKTAEIMAASSEQLTASADQSAEVTESIANSIAHVSEGAANQVSSVEMATSVIEKMALGIKDSAQAVNIAVDEAQNTVDKAQNGNAIVTKAVGQMQQIEAVVQESAQVVEKLGERSKEIGSIVDTISGIAGQTNLLALNTAIEAARAGELGRGFAVVAEEVRKLAEQSQGAAHQISTLISTIQKETSEAVLIMEKGTQEVKTGTDVVQEAGEVFTEIFQSIHEVSAYSSNVAKTMGIMAEYSDSVVDSIKTIDSVSHNVALESHSVSAATEEHSASIEEIAASSRSLAELAQELQDITRKFKLQ